MLMRLRPVAKAGMILAPEPDAGIDLAQRPLCEAHARSSRTAARIAPANSDASSASQS